MNKNKNVKSVLAGVVAVSALIAVPAIFDRLGSASVNASTPGAAGATTHGHEVNAHAPNVLSFADAHVEAQLLKNKQLRVFIYGEKERQLMPINVTTLEAEAVIEGEDSVPITLTAKPYPGEPDGKSSRFVAEMPDSKEGTLGLSLTVAYGGKTYRVHWQPALLLPGNGGDELEHEAAATDHTAMPTPLADRTSGDAEATPEEKKLFLTAGGKYSEADIAANGSTVAALKYRGEMASHDMNPKQGDLLCPVTNTKANQKFSWKIDGKDYKFCCPPCIEEFVRTAKEKPETIKAPEDYVKL